MRQTSVLIHLSALCLAFVLLLTAEPWKAQAAKELESCHLRELELCAVGATSLFQNPNGIALSEPEMKRQCEFLDESIRCHDDYTERCVTKGHADLAFMFTGDFHQMEEELCKNKSSQVRLDYQKHGGCFRQVQKKHQRRCISDLQAGLESIHKMDPDKRMITGCCSMHRFKDCIMSKVNEECGETASKLVESWIHRIAGNMICVVCRKYEAKQAECLAVLPPEGTKPFNGRNTSAISRIVSGYMGTGQ